MVRWGVGGGSSSFLFMMTQWGVAKYIFVAAILLKSRFFHPSKEFVVCECTCIVFVVWDSAQCYSVVCGVEMIIIYIYNIQDIHFSGLIVTGEQGH